VRLPSEVIKAVDGWAARNGQASRSHAIRAMIERTLKADRD
jgi:metal-responsive CopG/Arc/MetJ family transcriptional regulator